MNGPKNKKRQHVVSLRDIADELNLSVSMVSKVLNGRMGTTAGAPETIQAIHAKASKLGYRKNLQAQALRTGRQNIIAICVHRHGATGSGIVDAMIEGIAREAAQCRQRLILQYYRTYEEFRDIWHDFNRSAVDGVIMGGVPHADWLPQLEVIRRDDFAVVTIMPTELAENCLNVGMPESEICRVATNHLIEQGCRRIAHFCVKKRTVTGPYSQMRSDGYRRALAQHGLPVDENLLIPAEAYGYECGESLTQKLVDSGISFDGIVAQSDNQAAAAINVLMRCGVSVPHKVKVVGIDDSPICGMLPVKLSSVSQEYFLRGQRAVQLLLVKIEGGHAESEIVEPKLSVRQSTAG